MSCERNLMFSVNDFGHNCMFVKLEKTKSAET